MCIGGIMGLFHTRFDFKGLLKEEISFEKVGSLFYLFTMKQKYLSLIVLVFLFFQPFKFCWLVNCFWISHVTFYFMTCFLNGYLKSFSKVHLNKLKFGLYDLLHLLRIKLLLPLLFFYFFLVSTTVNFIIKKYCWKNIVWSNLVKCSW
jgi:hypothetical protein